MSNYQHTFTLRQHTPLIHFQADEEGAFIRVSELKPAFDRFLWEKVWTPHDDIESNVEMLICYTDAQKEEIINTVKIKENYQWDDWSLNYSVDIEDINEAKRKVSTIDNFPCYFADLGKTENKPQFVFYEPDFNITFTCYDSKLLEVIIKRFPSFLSKTNFGARKSKGFGSFTVIDNLTKLPILPNNKKGLYSFEINNMNDKTFRALFEHIDLFWKILRNGIDIPLKVPSILGKWVSLQNLHFDKPALKKYVDKSIDRNPSPYLNTNVSILYRDLLGLASTTEWHFQKVTMEKISTNTEKKIDRIMSPILVKPIRKASSSDYTVYLIVPLLNDEILKQEFKIELKNGGRNVGQPTTFRTASKDDILRHFMNYVESTYKDFFLEEYKRDNRPDIKKLKVVFGSLRKITQP